MQINRSVFDDTFIHLAYAQELPWQLSPGMDSSVLRFDTCTMSDSCALYAACNVTTYTYDAVSGQVTSTSMNGSCRVDTSGKCGCVREKSPVGGSWVVDSYKRVQ